MLVDSLESDHYHTLLEEGAHTVVIRQECAAVEPADSLVITVRAARSELLEFTLRSLSAVLTVESDPEGLPISIDGVPTGRVTPADLLCVEPGRHDVSVRPPKALGFTLEGDTTSVVEMGTEDELTRFEFSFDPLPQQRGVLVELFTATYCPNCPPADHAIDHLEHDPIFEADWLSCVEVHVRWGGTDPFYTPQIGERVLFYGDDQSAPYVWFNGDQKTAGSAHEDLEELYRAKIETTYGQDATVGLYWEDVRVEDGILLGGLRLVAIEDLSGYAEPVLHAFYAKDSLRVEQDPFGVGYYQGVVRSYAEPIDLRTVGAISAGSVHDCGVQFDLSLDTAPVLEPSHSAKVVAFVQDMATREVLQCRETRLRLP
jgi:hypothetical protein